jgi:hypothetical protein
MNNLILKQIELKETCMANIIAYNLLLLSLKKEHSREVQIFPARHVHRRRGGGRLTSDFRP